MQTWRKFRFELKNRPANDKIVPVEVIVFEAVRAHKQCIMKKRQQRGSVRKLMQEKQLKSVPSNIFYDEFGKMKENGVQFGNYTKCQSEHALTKAKREIRKHEYFTPRTVY